MNHEPLTLAGHNPIHQRANVFDMASFDSPPRRQMAFQPVLVGRSLYGRLKTLRSGALRGALIQVQAETGNVY